MLQPRYGWSMREASALLLVPDTWRVESEEVFFLIKLIKTFRLFEELEAGSSQIIHGWKEEDLIQNMSFCEDPW